MTSAEFWTSTIAEISMYLECAWLAQRDALDMMKAGAWWTAALSGQERLPKLTDVLTPGRKPRVDKPESLAVLKDEWRAFFNRARTA
jgi:hypothetical protein